LAEFRPRSLWLAIKRWCGSSGINDYAIGRLQPLKSRHGTIRDKQVDRRAGEVEHLPTHVDDDVSRPRQALREAGVVPNDGRFAVGVDVNRFDGTIETVRLDKKTRNAV
jgi:hypothetical protein